ncbi:MAG: NADH:flavin oxidoreductase/NADH oxidase [Firmicutes bacterium]|nr:NADH:flavin oxidoreductase/NADH oxidase [Bacillota bacterium]
MARLFESFQLRGITFPNRIGVAPMCQYQAVEGRAQEWHLVHYGGLAQGGAGLVIVEAAAVRPEGRITPFDLGLWSDEHIEPLRPVARFMASMGAVPGIQLAHAGRKAAQDVPWRGGQPLGDKGWKTIAPSALAFDEGFPAPHALKFSEIEELPRAFAQAARRALEAGFQVIEIHAAHGYLLHQFLSPLTNQRQDAYGGDLEGRCRLPLEVVEAVRAAVPQSLPLLVRISATDWMEGGWDLPSSIALAKALKARGVDLVDVSSGGLSAQAVVPFAPNYQVPFARAIRHEAQVPTSAVGLITEAVQAEAILTEASADLVLLGRECLRDPRWPLRAAQTLDATVPWPAPYARGARSKVPVR